MNTARILERVAAAAISSGRDPKEVTLLAATKTRTPEEIAAAISAGIGACGENRAQELLEKLPSGAYSGVPLHFIGSFQSNKAHLIFGKVDMIESLNSPKAARILSRLGTEEGRTTDVLVEINIGLEEGKAGIHPDSAESFCAELAELPCIGVRGLMAIPPAGCDGTPYFEEMRRLFQRIGRNMPAGFDTLSMGMSGDFEKAIACGATVVRVGTAIFGARDYGKK
ncbi:MAG: YggS family pyridoxal phosphate-dependent enzyme [Clostridia bacterium]|nr:YggS family pyridoxal phosphate-dependent enzyme [Clostridia bacterium]